MLPKKLTAILTALLLTAGLAGCAAGGSGGEAGSPAEGGDSAAPAPGVQGEEEEVLTVWRLWTTNNDANGNAFFELVPQWEAANPNVRVEMDATENEAFKTKIKTAIAANEAPDVFFSWGLGFAAPFAQSGALLPLDEYLEADGSIDRLLPGAVNNFSYGGKIYGLPYNSNVCVLFCNQALFDQHGVKLPETHSELLEAVETFREAGMVPMTVGAKDGWTAMFYHNAYTVKTAGADAVKKALSGEGSFNTPGFIKGVQMLSDLVNAGGFDSAALALTYDEAKISFMNGEIPMIYQGSWLVSEVLDESLSIVGDDIVAIPFPVVDGSEQYANDHHGGSTDCFMVSSSATNRDTAVDFVKTMAEGISNLSFQYGGGIPLWESDGADTAELDSLTRQILEISKQIDDSCVSWDVFLEGEATEKHKSLVQQVFAGTITPEEFVLEMDALER